MENGLIKVSADMIPAESSVIDQAAKIEGRTRAGFLRYHLIADSKKIIIGEKQNATINTNN